MDISISKQNDQTSQHCYSVVIGKFFININNIENAIHINEPDFEVFLSGSLYYLIEEGRSISLSDSKKTTILTNFYRKYGALNGMLEGHYHGIFIDKIQNVVQVFSDPFSRDNLFYTLNNTGSQLFTDRLSYIIERIGIPDYNQVALYNYLILAYTPIKDTFYKNISRLAPGEVFDYNGDGGHSIKLVNRVIRIEDYNIDKLTDYDDIFTSSVATRCSERNIIMNSGGWDSTAILNKLVALKGESNTEASVINLVLTDGTSFNTYEVDKVNRIGAYYGIKTNVCDVHYGDKKLLDLFENSIVNMRDKHVYFMINHLVLFDQLNVNKSNGSIFNGEISDSIHNFGYSQFVSVHYSNIQLREMADKAKSYLYSPSFFTKVNNKLEFEHDEVWNFFRSYYGKEKFIAMDDLFKSKNLFSQYLKSFMLSYARVPFAAYHNHTLAKPPLIKIFDEVMDSSYFNRYTDSINTENFYFYLLEIYKEFHFQSSQIKINYIGADMHGMKPSLPFYDLRMINFMAAMPENWGRGLELRPTKYPLRKLAVEKWNMPIHVLEEGGPHSYIAENDAKWSYSGGKWTIQCEILYNSVFSDYFKQKLSLIKAEDYFDEDYFDIHFLNQIMVAYCDGKQDINNHGLLYKLSLLFTIGLYK